MKIAIHCVLTLSTLAALMPREAVAHPGHGHGDGSYSPWHYFTEPEHVLLIAGILAGGLLLVHLARKAYQRVGTRRKSGASK